MTATDPRPGPTPSKPPIADPRDARLEQLLKLAETEPSDPFVLYGVAQEFARRERHDEAIAWYDRCLAADPAYCYAYFHKARSLEAMKRIAAAVATLRTGLERAKAAGDRQATNEIGAYIDELEDQVG
ncbi:MAG: hypothetical protein U0572_17420 [Phycisphaerales bacterium]